MILIRINHRLINPRDQIIDDFQVEIIVSSQETHFRQTLLFVLYRTIAQQTNRLITTLYTLIKSSPTSLKIDTRRIGIKDFHQVNLVLVTGTSTPFIGIVRYDIPKLPIRTTGVDRIRSIISIQYRISTYHDSLYVFLTFYLLGHKFSYRLLRKKRIGTRAHH